MNTLKTIHRFLLPDDKKLGYQPYLWLSYLLIYFFNYLFRTPSKIEIVSSVIGILIFLVLYFSSYRREGYKLVLHIAGIHLIGAILAIWNMGASVFFVYAACMCAFFVNPRHGFLGIGIILILIVLQSWLMDLAAYFYLPGIFFSALIGTSNIYFAQIERKNKVIKASQDEIKQLATTAERERIARDLHDLIGHTFSLITKKAELAKKLVDHDPVKAKQELQDIENTSRDALAQVRSTVSGYKTLDLFSEITTASGLCRASDIKLEQNIQPVNLSEECNQCLAYVLRETVTNIVRHSNGTRCSIQLVDNNQWIKLIITDDGTVKEFTKGNGLTGMQERVEQLNGTLTLDTSNGFQVTAEVPAI
ncbi:MAG: sensor histidine kinase [Gammaproteobacteria bacterium]|nr:sensor histidine kinase [Gammaproteobacteria bacterium]